MIDTSPYLSALIGGMLIGFSVLWLMWANGRIAGISGILGGAIRFEKGEFEWRTAFLIGMLAAPLIYVAISGNKIFVYEDTPLGLAIVAGLLVGVGTQMGSGCTSGHGVCGTSRFSIRSLIATPTFIITGIITVYIMRHIIGGNAS